MQQADATDPNQWLEDVTGEKPLAWVGAENAKTEAELAGTPGFDQLEGDILAVLDSDAKIPYVEKIGAYYYNFWQPVTAIRAGDSDGNAATAPDPSWIGLVVTPPHPEYPAAHGCFSGASTETLKFFFGSDDVPLRIDSNVPGLATSVRTYSRLSDALAEVLAARIYGGMHYRNSTRIGANVGKQVSRFTTRHFFKRENDKN